VSVLRRQNAFPDREGRIMRIVVPELMDAAAVFWLKARCDVHYEPTLVDERAKTLQLVAEADALIVKNRTQVDEALLAAAKKLRVVGRLGAGLDNIDVDACRKRGIAVYPAAGANARSVAEYVICTALMLLRPGLYTSSAQVAAGEWPAQQVRNGHELDGRTLGIVAMGATGQAVARLAGCLGMELLGYDPLKPPDDPAFRELNVTCTDLDELLARSDIVSLHVPLVKETRGLIGRAQIASMKKGALLINASRGGIVDDAALLEALREGRLGGAAVDVYEQEPLPAGTLYADRPANLLLTPHVAGATIESTERRGIFIAEKVVACLEQHRQDAGRR
jgi:(S)-sulfolactate dehydrogenase